MGCKILVLRLRRWEEEDEEYDDGKTAQDDPMMKFLSEDNCNADKGNIDKSGLIKHCPCMNQNPKSQSIRELFF